MKKFIKNILVQKRTKQYKERVRYLKNIRGGNDRLEEEAAKKGASEKEIAEAGMPLTPQELFALVFSNALKESCT